MKERTAKTVRKETPLTRKQAAFARRYVVHFNGTAACRETGSGGDNPHVQAAKWLAMPKVRAFVEQLVEEQNKRLEYDADTFKRDLMAMINADTAELYDETGQLKPIDQWPMVFRRGLVAGIEVEQMFEGRGDDREMIGTVRKIKLMDRKGLLEMLGRHAGVRAFKDTTELVPSDPLKQLFEELKGATLRPNEDAPEPAAAAPSGGGTLRPTDDSG